MNILVTGCAGFIGFHLSKFLCKKYEKFKVFGLDNLNNFYTPILKKKRLNILKKNKNFFFYKIDLIDEIKIKKLFKKNNIKIVIHLAAQAGVRDSLKIPEEYLKSNIIGFLNIINISNEYKINKFIYASSSSVYGDKKEFPLIESMKIDPKNIYSASKKLNEDIAHDLSKISDMKMIGLRFFTVYGKFGRPDMFIFKFLNSLFNKKKFYLYNSGNHFRDYTHIDDVVSLIFKIIRKKIKNKHDVYNICSNNSVDINKLVKFIYKKVNIKPKIINKKRNKIEVIKTHGANNKILKLLNTRIYREIYSDLPDIIKWYKSNNIWKLNK